MQKTILAADLGAESGRVMAVGYDGRGLSLQEVHRFRNEPVAVRGTLYWDVLRLWHHIQDGIELAGHLAPASIGVDTWGVDFALLDAHGNKAMAAKALGMSRATIYRRIHEFGIVTSAP